MPRTSKPKQIGLSGHRHDTPLGPDRIEIAFQHLDTEQKRQNFSRQIFKANQKELQTLLGRVKKGDRVGFEFSPRMLKANKSWIDAHKNILEIMPEVVEAPSEENYKKVQNFFEEVGIKTVDQDALLVAAMEKRGAKIVPLGSNFAHEKLEALDVAREKFDTLWQMYNSPTEEVAKQIQEIKSHLIPFKKLSKGLDELGKIHQRGNISEETWGYKLNRYSEKLRDVDRIMSIPVRDEYIAKQIIKHKCDWASLGDRHVSGVAEILKKRGHEVQQIHRKQSSRPLGRSWSKYKKVKAARKFKGSVRNVTKPFRKTRKKK